MNDKKQCVSVRLKPTDLEKIERIATRLKVRNSDVIRFALKTTLTRLMDLQDEAAAGYRLLPLFLEHSSELNRHFDLDADRIDEIINGPVANEQEKLDRTDIELLALCGLPPQYAQNKIQELTGSTADIDEVPQILNQYLVNKYKNRFNNEDNLSFTPLQ